MENLMDLLQRVRAASVVVLSIEGSAQCHMHSGWAEVLAPKTLPSNHGARAFGSTDFDIHAQASSPREPRMPREKKSLSNSIPPSILFGASRKLTQNVCVDAPSGIGSCFLSSIGVSLTVV